MAPPQPHVPAPHRGPPALHGAVHPVVREEARDESGERPYRWRGQTRTAAIVASLLPCAFAVAIPHAAYGAAPASARGYDGVTEVAAGSIAPAVSGAAPPDELAALRRRLEALEQRERERELAAQRSPAPEPSLAARPRLLLSPDQRVGEVGFGRLVAPSDYGLRLSGYLQLQYLHSQLSEDQLQQGGAVLNRDGFAVRRGRLRIAGDWRFVAFAFELDASTTRGPFIGVREASLSALWRNPDAKRPPYLMLTAGLTQVPFGYELRLSQRDMMFMERSLGSLAMFPGPVDVGVRLRGGVGPFRYDLAVMNGSPIADVAGVASRFDPTRKPDLAGRLGFDVHPGRLAIAGGASFLTGTGLHDGQDATKNQLQWVDLNENGTIETSEIFAVPGTAALPSVRFGRWGVDVDLQLGVRSKLGWTRLLGEVTLAQNLDRGLFVADPFAVGANLRHLQAYGALLQDLTRWAVVGLRYDLYDYNSDLLTRQRGRAVPADAKIHTISPLLGAVLPAGVVAGIRGRLVIQYDRVFDALGRDRRGVPTNLANDQVTVRVQVEF